jgi:hypothetical protein
MVFATESLLPAGGMDEPHAGVNVIDYPLDQHQRVVAATLVEQFS